MAEFKKAFALLMKHEGGYVNDPNDRGGETYKGIARHIWPKWEGWSIIDEIKESFAVPVTNQSMNARLADIESLQLLIADFYKANYWDPLSLDAERSQMIAEKAMDIAVNMGVGTARTFLKEATA